LNSIYAGCLLIAGLFFLTCSFPEAASSFFASCLAAASAFYFASSYCCSAINFLNYVGFSVICLLMD
jgi:hypothetical protein